MKKLAIIGAVSYGVYYLISQKKAAFKNIKPTILSARNLNIGFQESTLDIDVALKNTGSQDINIQTAGLARIKRVNLYSAKGTLIGHSSPGTTSLDIPANSTQIINNIPSVINSAYVIEALGDIANIGNVKITIDIEVGGKTITIQ